MKKEKPKNWRSYFLLEGVNPVIKFFTLSDVFLLGGFGLLSPIFAIYITENIKGGSIEVVGISQAIYLFTTSLLQIPIAFYIDKNKGERDDFWLLFFGQIASSLIVISYIFISTPLQLYFVQFFYGVSVAMTLPTWYAVFTRHIDKKHEGMEWGVYRTLTDLGGAFAAAIGGFLAFKFGFDNLFVLVSVVLLFGSFMLLFVRREMKKT